MAKVDGIVAVGIAKAITTRRLKTAGVPTIHIISSTTNGKAMFFNSTVPFVVVDPPIFTFPLTPTPPVTTNAPVVALLDCIDELSVVTEVPIIVFDVGGE